ncbi:M56 family metallopeptidase [Mucilaginibacter sp. P25]|uniref:Signal transducer regulating beta-lactamase production, contains metallopeptidase domain n=1 Tax=Mucilaginibacter gossypii TaxID=551996 RepID=A0A1G7NZU0_9SPHI|nr:M56 family metallopeptidase [Mucilaginibacter gossypii]SDF79377.1 Signal transducer regulating beta-lactamase production, contains metallopeptidase domain [Mucilaginibacter gossypii]
MPATFVFLLKVNIALLLFCAGYYLVLRPLTFYTLNRIYLLAAILFASIYPQINFSAFVQRHEELAKPMEQIAINWQSPAQLVSQPVQTFDYWYWLSVIFWTGAGLLLIRLALQLFSLLRLYKNSKPQYIGDHLVRVMDKDAAPFSFWRSIYVNPAKHEPADLKSILLHEQVHVNQWHTADILLAELSSIFYWFNPGIWLIKRAVRENIEFITDRKILKNGIDSKTYQYSLVNVSFNNTQPSIVNHFNISTIKKRIIMMNAKRSSKLNLTRYVFVVPAVMALLLVFSISKADFAKPVRITLAAAVQPLARIININPEEVVKQDAKPAKASKPVSKARTSKAAIPASPVVLPKVALSPLVAVAPLAIQLDTNKKYRITGDQKKDSLILMVNGAISTGKNLDATKIDNVYILAGDRVRKFAKIEDDKPVKVVYVITKDAPNKEELEKEVAKTRGISKVVTTNASGDVLLDDDNNNVNVNTLTIVPDNKNVDVKRLKNVVVVKGLSRSTSASSSSTVTVNGVKAKPVALSYSITSDDNVAVAGGGDVVVTGYGKKANVKALKVNGMNIMIDGKKDPLVIIDGKTSTLDAFKKMDINTIDSIAVMKSDEGTKKYGDKAKNGVVMISTRKK